MATANEELFDSTIRHQVGLRRLQAGEVKRLLPILEAADDDLTAIIAGKLAKQANQTRATLSLQRTQEVLRNVRGLRKEAVQIVKADLRGTLFELAVMEVEFEKRLIDASLPMQIDFASPPLATLRSIVTSEPFQGKVLNQWFNDLARSDQIAIQTATQLGIVEGEGIQAITRRVTRATTITRRNADALIRTAINHVSNRAREAFWLANEDIISALRWTSTLDGRTSPICQSRDGKHTPVGGGELPSGVSALSPPGARPPAHMNCRSIMIAVIDGFEAVGKRPTIRDSRTGRQRSIDFRKDARASLRAKGRTGTLSSADISREASKLRADFAATNIGKVPVETTYNAWLKRQPAGFQDEVLGKTKGALFRRGELTVDNFVDRQGTELTLSELANTQPEAFTKANVALP